MCPGVLRCIDANPPPGSNIGRVPRTLAPKSLGLKVVGRVREHAGESAVRPVRRKRTGRALGRGLALLLAAPLMAAEPQPQMTGDVQIHDPSVIEIGGQFVAVGTGQQGRTHGAIRVKTSPDGIRWTDAGLIGEGPPAWARAALGFKPSNVWAPSISRRGQTVFLYYCLSSFGHNTSAIGLMTNASFDPLKPGEGWRDQGLVLMSRDGDDFNAVDPFRIDTSDGRAYLAFGSFLSRLNPETGKLIRTGTPRIPLASRHGGGMEVASILEHGGKFILFVRFDQCCK